MSILLGHTARQTNQVGPRRASVILAVAILRSVRGVKSSQGIRRGTCGWITSFFYTKLERMIKSSSQSIFILKQIINKHN